VSSKYEAGDEVFYAQLQLQVHSLELRLKNSQDLNRELMNDLEKANIELRQFKYPLKGNQDGK